MKSTILLRLYNCGHVISGDLQQVIIVVIETRVIYFEYRSEFEMEILHPYIHVLIDHRS